MKLYKPNSKNLGCAINFSISSKGNKPPALFCSLIKQHSWNDAAKTGSFAESRNDPSKMINIKFNEFEVGEMLNSMSRDILWSSFHKSASANTGIKFGPYKKTRYQNTKEPVEVVCYGLSLVRNGTDMFKVGIEPGEAKALASFFENYLNLVNNWNINNQFKGANQAPAEQAATQEQEPEVQEEVEEQGAGF